MNAPVALESVADELDALHPLEVTTAESGHSDKVGVDQWTRFNNSLAPRL